MKLNKKQLKVIKPLL